MPDKVKVPAPSFWKVPDPVPSAITLLIEETVPPSFTDPTIPELIKRLPVKGEIAVLKRRVLSPVKVVAPDPRSVVSPIDTTPSLIEVPPV